MSIIVQSDLGDVSVSIRAKKKDASTLKYRTSSGKYGNVIAGAEFGTLVAKLVIK